jgi:hypothetical protein
MTLNNIVSGSHQNGDINTNDHIGFMYDNGWIYCGASGWTKAENNYDNDKREWVMKDHKTLYD